MCEAVGADAAPVEALWREAADVISTDPYPMYGSEPVGGYNHGQVAAWTRMTAQAVQHSRPIMTVLQFFKFDASRSSQGRWPTQTEMRNHAYMAIVEGAKGLMWWSLGENGLTADCRNTITWCAQRAQLMNQLKTVVSEIASLEPVLAGAAAVLAATPASARVAVPSTIGWLCQRASWCTRRRSRSVCERLVQFGDGRGAAVPEDLQDRQLSLGRAGRLLFNRASLS